MNPPTPHDLDRARLLLRRAARLSLEGIRARHGGPFGAVIVETGTDRVIAEGYNRVLSDCDPTAHAEVVAIRRAGAALRRFDLAGHEIFASAEPCPMCLAATFWARIDCVWFANTVQQAADIGFDDSAFYRELSLPPSARRVPQVHVPVEEAAVAFAEWAADARRVRY
jgi:tRNA(Arg) A34 adenosine deaminase TadA